MALLRRGYKFCVLGELTLLPKGDFQTNNSELLADYLKWITDKNIGSKFG